MSDPMTDAELLAYLDETLPVARSARVEELLRERSDLRQRLALLARRRDHGGSSVGEVWARHRLSCPSRADLGAYLLGVADPDLEDYILFHTGVVECRFCAANLDDLKAAQQDDQQRTTRQRRYFESSAGLLRPQSQDADP